jgi:hypothetical protein
MNLQRDGIPVDESTYIKTTHAMQKMQEITDRLAVNTPDLNKCFKIISFLSIFLQNKRDYFYY